MKLSLSLCPICDKPANRPDFLCKKCRQKAEEYNKLPKCAICGQPRGMTFLCSECAKKTPSYTLAASCYHYDEEFRQAMLDYKFHKKFYKAKGFSGLLREKLDKMQLEFDCITAVPAGPKTYWKRGYNAPLELAFLVSRSTKRPCFSNLLLKKWFTKQLSKMKGQKRSKEVSGKFLFFKPSAKKIKGKNILLIDDVFTTGSTANECARVLKKNGAAKVYVLTLLGNSREK